MKILGVFAILLIFIFLTLPMDAQQSTPLYRIGVLNEAWAPNHPAVEGLKSGLKELGFRESQNISFDVRFTKGDSNAMSFLAEELMKAGVDLIFTSNEAATQAAKIVTKKIPIVFTLVGDPVAAGIVKEIANPGGNITGVSGLETELTPKRLEILKTLVPTLRRVMAIYYADDPSSIAAVREARQAISLLKIELLAVAVRTPEEITIALQTLKRGDGLLPPPLAIMDIPVQILETSLSDRVPAVFSASLWAEYGGLVSYGSDYFSQGHQAARLVSKILHGARPKDLPVEGANKIELVVNLNTARRFGLVVPEEILLWADKVIE